MQRQLLKSCLPVLAVLQLGAASVFGFAIGGPRQGFQTDVFGYDRSGDGTGAQIFPNNLGEEYRVNVPNLFYSCDASFLDYFGARGSEEIDKAFAMFNALPNFSSMSENLNEYPLDGLRENYQAGALQITDLKSTAASLIMEQLGLAAPEIHIWDVQSRATQPNQQCPLYNFFVLRRNFDPVSWEPSSYVNGSLYTLQWLIQCAPAPDLTYPLPLAADPLSYGIQSVAGIRFPFGLYHTALTRDDVGGLRYLYRRNNYNMETMPPDVFIGFGTSGSPWTPYDPNLTNTPTGDTTALRSGVDQLRFQRRNYDSLLGQFFQGITNNFTVQVVTNNSTLSQNFSRAVLAPDIVFSAGNLDIDVGPPTFNAILRSAPSFATLNTVASLNGPGTLVVGASRGVIDIRLQKIGPVFRASAQSFLTEPLLTPQFRWGSYDGTTNAPVLYPSGSSIKDLEAMVLRR